MTVTVYTNAHYSNTRYPPTMHQWYIGNHMIRLLIIACICGYDANQSWYVVNYYNTLWIRFVVNETCMSEVDPEILPTQLKINIHGGRMAVYSKTVQGAWIKLMSECVASSAWHAIIMIATSYHECITWEHRQIQIHGWIIAMVWFSVCDPLNSVRIIIMVSISHNYYYFCCLIPVL